MIALSQAPWFNRMVNDEARRREVEEKLGSNAVTALKEHHSHYVRWEGAQLSRFAKLIAVLESMAEEAERVGELKVRAIDLLGEIRAELHVLNARLPPSNESAGA